MEILTDSMMISEAYFSHSGITGPSHSITLEFHECSSWELISVQRKPCMSLTTNTSVSVQDDFFVVYFMTFSQ
jgi:hypothetical protein